MFSNIFNPAIILGFFDQTVPAWAEMKDILQRYEPDLEDMSKLILGRKLYREEIIQAAISRRKERWHNQLFLMPPLYTSGGDPEHGGCLDHCLYCPWRHGNVPQEQIVRLSKSEIEAETKSLMGRGYGDIEIVAATDPLLRDAQNCAEQIRAAKRGGALNVGINFFPLRHISDYSTISDAGCTFAIVWQELYEPDLYAKMHPHGPKSNMAYRLNAHDRACQGGIGTVGVAFLGCLSDPWFEALSTIQHARYLKSEYGANIIFGMPRWKGNGGGIRPVVYNDDDYALVGALYSLATPDSLVWFSTREDFDLSARAAEGGGCLFTLDCSTRVGYTRTDGSAQFPVHSMDIEQGLPWLKGLGFVPQIHLPW
jgi:2-iminoacetate synthase